MNTPNVFSQPGAISLGLAQWMSRHTLISFFLLTYAISWLLSIPVILLEWQILPKNMFTFTFSLPLSHSAHSWQPTS